ncbi:MAG: nucleoside triphosphate pyrophosphohydrolase, partial [Clostridia bacterium]|nr:nucleoside triphosphate pyrophosphohydrolase [Clostridia bacterium]
LVRDKIPEIIEKDGKKANIEIIEDDDRYVAELKKKLVEEVDEFLKDESMEELGDVFQVMLAILKVGGYNLGDLCEIADAKEEEKGGFNKRIFLKSVE